MSYGEIKVISISNIAATRSDNIYRQAHDTVDTNWYNGSHYYYGGWYRPFDYPYYPSYPYAPMPTIWYMADPALKAEVDRLRKEVEKLQASQKTSPDQKKIALELVELLNTDLDAEQRDKIMNAIKAILAI